MHASSTPRRGGLRPWFVVLGVLVALVLAAWGAITVLLPPDRVRAIVQQQLARSISREVRFADAGVTILPPVRLTVRDVAVSEAGGFARGTMLQARSIHLDLDVPALLGRRIRVRRLILDEPGLHLVLRPDGTTNLDGMMKPEPKGAPRGQAMDLTVNEFGVRRGRLIVDDLKVAARRALLVDTKIALDTQRGGTRVATSGTTRLSEFAFGRVTAARMSDLNNGLAKVELSIDHRGLFDSERKRLALERLDLGLGRAKIALAGVVDDPGPTARLDLTAHGSGVDFGEVLRALAAADARAVHGVTGSGRLDFDLVIRGRLGPHAAKAVTGTLKVSNAAFHYPGAPAGVEALTFTARLAPDSIAIRDLAARVSGQPLRGQLDVARFRDPLVRFAVQGNVDLAAVGPLVAPKDTKLGGRVALDVSGRGRAKDPGSMALGGTARLADVSVESPAVPKKIEGVTGQVAFTESRADVKGLTAKAGGSSFTLDAAVTRPLALLAKPGSIAPSHVDFDFRSPRLDLADVLPAESGPLIVPNATGGGHASIDRLLNRRLDLQRVRADVGLEPGIVTARSFAMAAYGGFVTGSSRLDLRDAANPIVTLKAKVDSMSADAVLTAWTPARNFIQGSLTTTLDFAVEGATPERMKQTLTAIGIAEMARGQVGPGPVLQEIARVVHVDGLDRLRFDQAKIPFRVERGRIVSDPFVLRGGTGEWRIAGAVGFDGALDYAVSATLPPAVTDALKARSAIAAGALTDANGNLLLDLRVGGTAKSPRVSWDPSAMRDRVAGRVSQAIEQQQQKLENEFKQAAEAQQKAAEDSLRRVTERMKQAIRDSIRRAAADVFRGFFGKPAAGDAPSDAPKDSTAP